MSASTNKVHHPNSARPYFLAGLSAVLILSSCVIPFIPEVPPSSYSVEAAINVLGNKYYILDSGEVDGFGETDLGDGRYATFGNVDGVLLVFKYDSPAEARRMWDAVTKRFNNPLRLKYLRLNLGAYGLFTVRLDGSDLYVWFKDVWLFIVNGDKIDAFVRDVNGIYRTTRPN